MKAFGSFAFLTISLFGMAFEAMATPPAPSSKSDVQQWCEEVRKETRKFKWRIDPCNEIDWKVAGHSIEGRPLVYTSFGPEDSDNTTLILTMVHGDEITPLFLGIQLAHWVRQNPNTLAGHRVVIAPLVNPDSFFASPRKRTNAHGVDVNRNFSTKDWDDKALKAWRIKFKSNPRRFPGKTPDSEPETIFQRDLINLVKPQKILSVHAPLNFFDYDGPVPSVLTLAKFPKEYVQACIKLRNELKAVSGGFFPGSLGNYAGRELGIPTITLELPTADPHKAEGYWYHFKTGIKSMITFKVPDLDSLPPQEPSPQKKLPPQSAARK